MMIRRTTDVTLWDFHNKDGMTIVSVASTPWNDGVFLFRVWTKDEHRRRGLATLLLEDVIENLQSQRVYLEPAPFMDAPMNKQQLSDWYGGLGFRWFDDRVMVRESRSDAPA